MPHLHLNSAQSRKRPKFLNLVAIRLPLSGFVSILHRISGGLLFLCLPGLIALFGLSLESPAGFARVGELVLNPLIGLPLLVLLWAYVHHFCAGIRFLLLDLQIGLERQAAFRSSVVVMVVSLGLTVLLAGKVLGVL